MCRRLAALGAATVLAVTVVPACALLADPPLTVGGAAYVNVSVATLWTSPTAPRAVDAPALGHPADVRGWLAAMDTSLRRGLNGRVETQALLGERLLVVAISPDRSWVSVRAVAQGTHRDPRGYPGWVPARQLTTHRPSARATVATVVTPTTWLRALDGTTRVVELSFGTRLPVVRRSTTDVRVSTPGGGLGLVAAAAVAVAPATAAALPALPAAVDATSRTLLGRPYLWGGRSGFAVDCSGFTDLVFGVHGVTVPRDADDQAGAGSPVARSALRAGDLVFFWRGATIGHVAMYAGGGQVTHAPGTGDVVRVAPLPDVAGYAWARRFV